MSRVVVTHTARADLDSLIRTHNLPESTRDRVKASVEPLGTFPLLGRGLLGRWAGLRVVLGPWPWMLLVYSHDERTDVVSLVFIHDARSAGSATER